VATNVFTRSRELVRIAYRDPEHLPERLTLAATQRLGERSFAWAQDVLARRGERDCLAIAEERRRLTARVARIDGAIAGTPFFVALIPAYVDYLWHEASMVLRIAALYGRDPRELGMAADLLVLRGVHPSLEDAQRGLDRVRATPIPSKPARRRPLRTWVASVRSLMVYGGFLSPPKRGGRHPRLMTAAGVILGAAVWVLTWIFPLTFMIAMAWGCERNARDLGRRAELRYGGEPLPIGGLWRRSDGPRRFAHAAALSLSVALPIGFIAYADHERQVAGFNGVSAAGILVALALVIATAVVARRW
jgi:hypothetical protein